MLLNLEYFYRFVSRLSIIGVKKPSRFSHADLVSHSFAEFPHSDSFSVACSGLSAYKPCPMQTDYVAPSFPLWRPLPSFSCPVATAGVSVLCGMEVVRAGAPSLFLLPEEELSPPPSRITFAGGFQRRCLLCGGCAPVLVCRVLIRERRV